MILVVGMARGGTNILWNIIQSHPDVIDSYYEINEIFGKKTNIGIKNKLVIELCALTNCSFSSIDSLIRSRVRKFASYSFHNDEYNKYKYSNEKYSPTELNSLTICTKLVSSWENNWLRTVLKRNDATKYIPLIEKADQGLKKVFLIRNGYAMVNSWKRRGATVEIAAKWYQKYVSFYEQECERKPENTILIRYEDVLENPFGESEKIFEFLGLKPKSLKELRIALKPTINNSIRKNETKKEKIWVNSTNFFETLDCNVNAKQLENLTAYEIEYFTRFNEKILRKYGYEI